MRNLFGAALKDNASLERGVLTGILRLAKENLFSGLNNLEVCTLLNRQYNRHFGLLEDEVKQVLLDHKISSMVDAVRGWHNGYIFGNVVIYNPWSVLNFVKNHPDLPKPYWINTSDNELVKQLLTRHGRLIQEDLERLLRRKSVWKIIDEHVALGDIDQRPDALWSLLLFSGYLKAVSQRQAGKEIECELLIPNLEVEYLYEKIIFGWL